MIYIYTGDIDALRQVSWSGLSRLISAGTTMRSHLADIPKQNIYLNEFIFLGFEAREREEI